MLKDISTRYRYRRRCSNDLSESPGTGDRSPESQENWKDRQRPPAIFWTTPTGGPNGRLAVFETLHSFSERPQGAINTDTLIDALDWSRRAAADLAVGILATSRQSAAQHVFLNDLERGPKALPGVLAAARIHDLFWPHGAVLLAAASDKTRFRQHLLLWFGQTSFLHCSDASISRGKFSATVKTPSMIWFWILPLWLTQTSSNRSLAIMLLVQTNRSIPANIW